MSENISARELTRSLQGKWSGNSGSAACPVCQPERRKDQSALSLKAGDDGHLLLYCHKSNCEFGDILKAAGYGASVTKTSGRQSNQRQKPDPNAQSSRKEAKARKIWDGAVPITDTLAEAYLRGRAITCDLPDTLRFHPDVRHEHIGKSYPALVARVDGSEGLAIHRTYLRPDGSGKAEIEPSKMMLGSVTGGAVRLADEAGTLIVAEGIETALSLANRAGQADASIWAALSASGMKALRLPKPVGQLIVAADGDKAGREAAAVLAKRAVEIGWEAFLLHAPEGQDWNDSLKSGQIDETLKPVPFKSEGPQPLVREIPTGADYPVEALGPLQKAVEAVQGRTQAPIAIAAQSALAIASLAVQGFADVQTLGGRRPLSLYALTIAKSGERKSGVDSLLLASLREYERERANARRKEMVKWQNAHAIWKLERDQILNEVKKSKGTNRVGAENNLEALGAEPTAPPSTERTVTEPTFEGLTRLFAEGQPSLGIFSDEGGQFLGGNAMLSENRQKTMAALNDLWQGNPIRRTRQGDGAYTLYGRRLAVHLMVQPAIARKLMADQMAADIGFLSRFLITEPTSTIGSRLQCNARRDDTALTAFDWRLSQILQEEMPMDQASSSLEPGLLRLTDEAENLLAEFADEIELSQAPGGRFANITGAASKAAEQAARIAGVQTLFDELAADCIEEEYMANGIELARFYLGEASRLTNAASVSYQIDRAENLRRWLVNTWEHPEITLRDVLQLGPNDLRESPKAKDAIAILETHGWLVRLEEGTVIRGSSRKEAWRIVKEETDEA